MCRIEEVKELMWVVLVGRLGQSTPSKVSWLGLHRTGRTEDSARIGGDRVRAAESDPTPSLMRLHPQRNACQQV